MQTSWGRKRNLKLKKHKYNNKSAEFTMANKAKPDYIDLDKDGNKAEPMKKAAKDAKKKTNEDIGKAVSHGIKAAGEVGDSAVKGVAKAAGYASGLPKGLKKAYKDGQKKASGDDENDDKKKKTNEGLGELADMAERDHEVQMARAELYKIAKYAIKLHDLLKNVTEAEGIEGWQQSKITKAADYIGSVFHSLEYDKKVEPENKIDPMVMAQAAKESKDPYKSRLHSRLSEMKKKVS